MSHLILSLIYPVPRERVVPMITQCLPTATELGVPAPRKRIFGYVSLINVSHQHVEIERVKGMMTRQRKGEEAHRREARRWREIK